MHGQTDEGDLLGLHYTSITDAFDNKDIVDNRLEFAFAVVSQKWTCMGWTVAHMTWQL